MTVSAPHDHPTTARLFPRIADDDVDYGYQLTPDNLLTVGTWVAEMDEAAEVRAFAGDVLQINTQRPAAPGSYVTITIPEAMAPYFDMVETICYPGTATVWEQADFEAAHVMPGDR